MCLAGSRSAWAQQANPDEQGTVPAPAVTPATEDPAPKTETVDADAKVRAQVNQLSQEIAEHDVQPLSRLSEVYTEKSDAEKLAAVEALKKVEDERFEKAREAQRVLMPKAAYLQTCQAMRETGEAKAAQKAGKDKARNASTKDGGAAKDAAPQEGVKGKLR
jgi:LPS O-antigen subunit length determinant protein (WzzB/FepE family)